MAGAINGASIARGASFKDRMGEQVAASGLTFVDDPLRPRGMGSRLFDGEGLAVKRREMVKDGVLQGWFLDIASATKLASVQPAMPAAALVERHLPRQAIFIWKMVTFHLMSCSRY